ncbi:MAG: ATPase, partial [Betaproteobacteria bacterium]
FEPAAIEGIFKASGGIPRRINAVCDRLLLAGFLAGRTALTLADVDEVVKEFTMENAAAARPAGTAPQPALLGGEPTAPGGLAGLAPDVDLSQIKVDGATAEEISKQLAALTADARGDQLQRLERSLLRLERTNVQILGLLSKLVAGVKKPGEAGE